MARKGSVAVTQPRRVAAVSVAKRVAAEKGVPLGEAVWKRTRPVSTPTKVKRVWLQTLHGDTVDPRLSEPRLSESSFIRTSLVKEVTCIITYTPIDY